MQRWFDILSEKAFQWISYPQHTTTSMFLSYPSLCWFQAKVYELRRFLKVWYMPNFFNPTKKNCQVQVLPNLFQWHMGVRHRDSLQRQGESSPRGLWNLHINRMIFSSIESIILWRHLYSVWWPFHSWCVDLLNENGRQSQPVPSDSPGQLQIFCR